MQKIDRNLITTRTASRQSQSSKSKIPTSKPKTLDKLLASILAAISMSSLVSAQDIRFTPINPSFGGNPFNSAHLLGLANTQNTQVDPATLNADGSAPTQSELFVRSLQSRLLSTLAREVTDAIFGEDPQDSGTVVFGEQTVSFNRGLETVSLTIVDASTGTETSIEIPTFATSVPGIGGTSANLISPPSLTGPLILNNNAGATGSASGQTVPTPSTLGSSISVPQITAPSGSNN